MSLVPAFEIGIWNAWIFMLYELLTIPFLFRIAKNREPDPEGPFAAISKTKKVIFFSSKVLLIPAFIYSIFLPLKLGTIWFYAGLPITLIGLIAGTIVLVNWVTTPRDEPVTRGLYRYSRHPMYLAGFVFLLGLGIATASWVFILFAVIITAVSFAFAYIEEQTCLEKYGNAYREYMNRTPKYIGISR
jgi:protein-S-isoprenylcysteine O-methyltransferase Ste14